MSWFRRHALVVVVTALAVLSVAAFTWAEWHFFVDNAVSHHERAGSFWGGEHLHDWLYNAAANWQSELLMGVLLVILLKKIEGPGGADREDA